jgi:hypothetical protein
MPLRVGCRQRSLADATQAVQRRDGDANKRPRTTKVSEPELDALIEEATVDTYNG